MRNAEFNSTHLLQRLVSKNIFRFGIEPGCRAIELFQVARMTARDFFGPDMSTQQALNDGGAGTVGPGAPVDLEEEVFGQCDRRLLFHTTNILLSAAAAGFGCQGTLRRPSGDRNNTSTSRSYSSSPISPST